MDTSTKMIPARLAELLIVAVAVVAAGDEPATEKGNARPVELGAVDWSRDFDAAVGDARKSGKPLLVLFQEVPG